MAITLDTFVASDVRSGHSYGATLVSGIDEGTAALSAPTMTRWQLARHGRRLAAATSSRSSAHS
jgi:hypothetical protein